MALKIRLRQQGRRNRAVFRLVLSDSRSPRDGKYVEMLGCYNPYEADLEKGLTVQTDRVLHWLNQGAVLTEKAEKLVERRAPEAMADYRQKKIQMRAKACQKRKAGRKKKAG
ncbi:MAG: 30S ribosomal protein S16 [Chlamydiales bacterium]